MMMMMLSMRINKIPIYVLNERKLNCNATANFCLQKNTQRNENKNIYISSHGNDKKYKARNLFDKCMLMICVYR